MAASRDESAGDVPIIVDISARFLFPSRAAAANVATRIRRRHDARVRIAPIRGDGRSQGWRLDARIPQTRFDLARLRLLADELARAAETDDGMLVTWDAVRPGGTVTARH